MPETADVVVIGGGCTGTSVAMRLAQRGVKKVVLVEKNYLASGPTGKSIANIVGYTSVEPMMKVIQRSVQIVKHFKEDIGGDPGMVPTTRLRLAPEKNRKELEADAKWQKKLGVNLHMLSREDVKELMPQLNTEDIGAAVQYLDACYLNPVATTDAYANRARDLGAEIREETEVTGIKVSGGKIRSVVTSKGEISTRAVVVATGPWSPRIGRMVGIELPIEPKRVESCFFLRPWDFRGVIPTVHNMAKGHMFRGEGEDIMIAFDIEAFLSPERLVKDPDKFSEDIGEPIVKMWLAEIPQLFPSLKRTSYRGGHASLYDCSPDESPILGKVPEVEGLYLCCGWSGIGFQQSMATGEVLAELITEDKTSLIDWTIFSLNRFKEGRLIPRAWGFH
jgi:sarcosine oxidase subunit beta